MNIEKSSQPGLLVKTEATWKDRDSAEKSQGEDRAGVCPPEPRE